MLSQSLLFCLAAIVCAQALTEHLVLKNDNDRGDVLDKLRPTITEVSKSIATAAKAGEDMEHMLIAVITKNLVQQIKKFRENFGNNPGNFTTDPCCVCASCSLAYYPCSSCVCCGNGTTCWCNSCPVRAQAVAVDHVDIFSNPSIKRWMETSKTVLTGEVSRAVLTSTKASDRCCTCANCRQPTNGCGGEICCEEGEDCTCKRCSTNSIDLIAAKIWNPISLTPVIEKSINEVASLVDSMTLYLS